MYAGIHELWKRVIDLSDEYEEYGPTPEGYKIETVEVPEGAEVELGYIFDPETNTFAPEDRSKWPVPPEPEPYDPEPTQEEILEKIAINSEYLAAMAEMEATE